VEQTWDYYPFGLEMPGRSIPTGTTARERFTGHERDEEVGLDYMKARRYAPEFGRFLSVDPMADQYPGISPYSYALNNPLIFVDPTGEYLVAASGRYVTRQSRGMLRTISFFQHIPGGSALISTAIKADLSRDPSVDFNASDYASLVGGGIFKGMRHSFRAVSRQDKAVNLTMAALDNSFHAGSVALGYILSQDAALFVDEMIFVVANREGFGAWNISNRNLFMISDRVANEYTSDIARKAGIDAEFSRMRNVVLNIASDHQLNLNTRHGRHMMRYLMRNYTKSEEEKVDDDDLEKP
jgi:RHS repeat-associated protein